MEIVSFCTELIPLRVIVHKPSVQSVDFPCENPDCAGMKVHYDKDEYDDEEGRIVGLLGATAEIVAEEGRDDNDVKEMLQQMGIDQADMEELSDATIEKWTGLAEDKLKQMAVNGDTIQDVKKVRSHCLFFLTLSPSTSLRLYFAGPPGYYWFQVHELHGVYQGCHIWNQAESIWSWPSQCRRVQADVTYHNAGKTELIVAVVFRSLSEGLGMRP